MEFFKVDATAASGTNRQAFHKTRVAHLGPGKNAADPAAAKLRLALRAAHGPAKAGAKQAGVVLDMSRGGHDAEDAEFEKF